VLHSWILVSHDAGAQETDHAHPTNMSSISIQHRLDCALPYRWPPFIVDNTALIHRRSPARRSGCTCLTYLADISLQGTSVQVFNMNPFVSTPLVKTIRLSMCETLRLVGVYPGYTYNDSLPNSPHSWSWGRYLSRLTFLDLGPGFAPFFEFQMLDHCPSLAHLIPAIHGPDARPGRRPDSDLFSSRTTSGYISCPELSIAVFEAAGSYLRSVYVRSGCNTKDWVDACRYMKNLQHSTLHVPQPTVEEIEELGLVPHDGRFEFDFAKRPAQLRFDGGNRHTFVSVAVVLNDV
ncbi:hypothetical protein BGZ93_011232, partial [Podila epicladia]